MSEETFKGYVIVLETGSYPIIIDPTNNSHISVKNEEEREKLFYELNCLCAKTITRTPWIKLGCHTGP